MKTIKEVMIDVLESEGPIHYKDVAPEILKRGVKEVSQNYVTVELGRLVKGGIATRFGDGYYGMVDHTRMNGKRVTPPAPKMVESVEQVKVPTMKKRRRIVKADPEKVAKVLEPAKEPVVDGVADDKARKHPGTDYLQEQKGMKELLETINRGIDNLSVAQIQARLNVGRSEALRLLSDVADGMVTKNDHVIAGLLFGYLIGKRS